MPPATARPVRRRLAPRALAALALLAAAACGRDEVTAPVEPVEGALTVNGSTGWAYVSLATGQQVTPADPATSAEWDLAFNATNVMLNGGAAGPGGVTGVCLCQNAQATNEQVLAMTADGELADFTAVTSANVPAAASFEADVLTPAFAGWYTGSGAAATAATGRAWLVRLRNETAFAKVRVLSLTGATAATPGRVTLEIATQDAPTGTLGAPRTIAVDVPAAGTARVDLLGGAVTTSATDWDLRFDGWTVRANGGASGSGRVAVSPTTDAWESITTAWVGVAAAYATDVYGGVFRTSPWHRYNLLGDHRISPVYNVYLVRRGAVVYKVQVTNYYGPAGETRRISFRYEQIAG